MVGNGGPTYDEKPDDKKAAAGFFVILWMIGKVTASIIDSVFQSDLEERYFKYPNE